MLTLAQLLALFKAALTPEARTATATEIGIANRQQAHQTLLERAQALRAQETRTADENAEMLLCLDGVDALRALITADNATLQRFAAAEAFENTPAGNPAVFSRGTQPGEGQAAVVAARATPIEALRGAGFNLNGPEARAMIGDLESYGLRDQQIELIASREYVDEFMRWIRSCASNPQGSYQSRALSGVTIDAGGAVVPMQMLAEIIQRRRAAKRVSSMVRRFQCSTDKLNVPKTNMGSSTQTNDLAVQWVGAQGSVTEDTSLQEHGSVEISIHRGGVLIVADRAWLEDAAFDMESWIIEQIADMYESMLEYIIINGTGVGRPFGLVTRTGDTTPGDNEITSVNIGDPVDPTGLMNIIGNLDAVYAERAEWLWKRTALYSQVISLRDSAGGFLFGTNVTTQGGTTGRVDSQLLGYPVTQSDHMAAVGAGNKIAYFGDFRAAYGLVERVTLMIEPYIDPAIQVKDQRGWYVRFRVGGDVLADWAIRCGLNTDV